MENCESRLYSMENLVTQLYLMENFYSIENYYFYSMENSVKTVQRHRSSKFSQFLRLMLQPCTFAL